MYLIRDSTNDGQQFPLTKLLEEVCLVDEKAGLPSSWLITSVQGYGLDVCALEDAINTRGSLSINAERLVDISRDENQWFYDLRCLDPGLNMEFGVLDSAALFLQGNEEQSRLISSCFGIVDRR